MNQAILFDDQLTIDWSVGTVRFDVQWGGQLVPCLISISELQRRSGDPLINAEQVGVAFEQLRFDLEEEAEALIEEEAFDVQGMVWLGHPNY